MFNFTLYKRSVRENINPLIIFSALLILYFLIIISMFDPKFASVLEGFTESMPELMSMFGMTSISSTLIGFMSTYLYGFIMLVFPMVFSILCANKLVAHHVESGAMTYLLAAPISRPAVAFTQLKVLISGISTLIFLATIVGLVGCHAYFPGELDVPKFLLLNCGALCLQLFIGSVCFLSSCIFNDSKYSLAFGAGIPTLSLLLQMAASDGEKFKGLRFASFFTLFNPEALIAGKHSALWGLAILLAASFFFYFLGIVIFSKKDLHI